MLANASTGVLERCVLRISVRKECKGGRSFTKLGFVDLNLAEYAGAGVTCKKALLEGYDSRHRQDNSMLKFSIEMNMLSGDILFKVPSPSHKQVGSEENNTDSRGPDDYSGGSIASGSSGFGSLPKKRPPLLSSELVIGHTLPENNVPITLAVEQSTDNIPSLNTEAEEVPSEQGHSRNSSNTSQMSKASGYSSIHSHTHSRQSSSGDSGHIRDLHKLKRGTTFSILSTFPDSADVLPKMNGFFNGSPSPPSHLNATVYGTPRSLHSQISNVSSNSTDEYKTPDGTLDCHWFEIQKSFSCDTVGIMGVVQNNVEYENNKNKPEESLKEGVLRSKSDYQIPRYSPISHTFEKFVQKSDNLFSFLTPVAKRKNHDQNHSTPNNNRSVSSYTFKIPSSPIAKQGPTMQTRTSSLTSLKHGSLGLDFANLRQPQRNPSSSSLVLSETGSLDRAKAALERRKKAQMQETESGSITGRVEETRVNPDHLIAELLKNTNLEPADDSAETSGLQLFIAKDGTAALGNHEVKSQMSTGMQLFKQVVVEDNR
ncbi:N-terminal C2 in EEIG1 and EHBP1 protein [Popillia japonica]|uniref:N-terminal C2 in EEIG1 and EHBP1 protein n=1 Tax=Popillia japonica TaxID=7064 RepID=A0AAW1KZK9_POPJA